MNKEVVVCKAIIFQLKTNKLKKEVMVRIYNGILMLSHFSHVRLCATPWTAAYQAPLSMGFSREEYWSALPLPSPNGILLSHKKWSTVLIPKQIILVFIPKD